jgi:hypothetical protein
MTIGRADVRQNPAWGTWDFHIVSYWNDSTGEATVMRPITEPAYQTIKRGEMYDEAPAFRVYGSNAQILFDAMYRAGFRPSSGETGDIHKLELDAVRAHLADMRLLAFRSIESEGGDMPLSLEKMVI